MGHCHVTVKSPLVPNRGLSLVRSFLLTYAEKVSGAEGIRTPDLRRAKADQHIVARPSLSGDFDVLQAFCRIAGSSLSTAYKLVSAWLQYGCSTFAQARFVPGSQVPYFSEPSGTVLHCWADGVVASQRNTFW
jgi:hypothetical protein